MLRNGPEYYRASDLLAIIDEVGRTWTCLSGSIADKPTHYREIRALSSDPERELPGTMLPIDDAARGAAAHGYAKSAQVARVILSGFVWMCRTCGSMVRRLKAPR